MHQAESANPKNTRNFYRVFDESGYNRENNREFLNFRAFSAILAPNRRANSASYNKIPYATEQGIILTEQGINLMEQGICEFASRISDRSRWHEIGCICGWRHCRAGARRRRRF
jgi:hypothetical protein